MTALRTVAITQLELSDYSYTMVIGNIWCNLEPCLGIMSACLPILQPTLAKMLGGNPMEWTRKSISSSRSNKTGTIPSSSMGCAKTDNASETWPPLPLPNRTQSSTTNKTWPMTNERRVVRFKDVEWGDYFPRRVNTVPMSVFHFPGAERRHVSADGVGGLEIIDDSVSPRCKRVSPVWERVSSEDSGDSSQYWD